jgi:hypothetical protein
MINVWVTHERRNSARKKVDLHPNPKKTASPLRGTGGGGKKHTFIREFLKSLFIFVHTYGNVC